MKPLTREDHLRLSRLITRLETLPPDADPPTWDKDARVGRALRIGVTGPLGVGKSTLVNGIARNLRSRGLTVGILATDPSSPISGGALLGDRVRMTDLAGDEGTFIRSLATRGAWGGLASIAVDAADLLDQAGFDRIILETVGVGQVEVDIVEACDVTVVVLEPSSGDAIQTLKAGLMEVADIFVVNKADLRGADRFLGELEQMLEMRRALKGESGSWQALQREESGHHQPDPGSVPSETSFLVTPPIRATIARTGVGIPELADTIEQWLKQAKAAELITQRRQSQLRNRLRRLLEEVIALEIWHHIDLGELERLVNDGLSPRQVVQTVIRKLKITS